MTEKQFGKLWRSMIDSSMGDVGVPYHAIEEAKDDFPKLRIFDEDGLTFEFYPSDEIKNWFKKWFGDDE